jgi:hypothetical protein
MRTILGLIALVPAACNAPVVSARTLAMPLCNGDGRVLATPLPLDGAPAGDAAPCCAKGCHSGCRKRGLPREIDR